MEDLAVLQREHAALRHRVLRLLESCAGELVHGAQLSPHGPLPVSPHLPQPPRAPLPPRGPIPPAPDPHAELQRGLLDFLVVRGATLALPASAAALLSLTIERHPELSRYEQQVGAGNVTRALFELQNLVPAAVRVEQGELAFLDATALSAFQDRLLGRPSAGALAGTAGGGDKGGRKRTATAAHDSELAAVMDLVGTKSAKEKERQEQAAELRAASL